jgi:hypothetical protein
MTVKTTMRGTGWKPLPPQIILAALPMIEAAGSGALTQ